MEAQIDKFFAACNDFELCEILTSVLEEYYGFENLKEQSEKIPIDRRLIHFLWGVYGIIEGDGYAAFWAMDCDHSSLVEALKLIRMHILADIAQKSLANIPPDKLGDWDALVEYFGGDEGFAEAVDLYDAKFINERPDITGNLASYIRLNRYSYCDLVNDLEEKLIAQR